MITDTSEKGLETIIVESLKNDAGYIQGSNEDYDRDHSIDLKMMIAFLSDTQQKSVETLHLKEEGSSRTQFLHRLQGEIAKRGVVDVLRTGIKHKQFSIDLFYGSPSEENEKAKELYRKNIFSVTRQLHFSKNETMLSLDMVIFINGLPIATFELKNKLTKQTVQDAIWQYKRDRDPKELLFQFGRCAVHFAVDDHEVWMCTHLKGKSSWFLPFNKGYKDGAGNPPNPQGIATDYLWKSVLNKDSLTNILENYAQIVEEKDSKNRKKQKQIFPRYHQLDVVRKLLKDAEQSDMGKRYLIQHSAGSGKSNSIAWLAHQLVGLKKDEKVLFDSIIIVTDRRNLDKQIRDTIKQFAQVSAVVGAVTEGSKQLKTFIEDGKKIIISTVQKFPFILKEIGDSHRSNKFAIIIDEAHSSQGGRVSSQMNVALASKDNTFGEEEEKSIEDTINELMESKKMISNANYFAFTATPKNKTLEIFGEPFPEGEKVKHKAFHSYTMKQAIQ
ncbi:MAG: type I restriction endonuclease, partial [Candidatus Aceula meridiana]|nr:type I restriction endonuclease [Candidatus Aceula meridiana]